MKAMVKENEYLSENIMLGYLSTPSIAVVDAIAVSTLVRHLQGNYTPYSNGTIITSRC
jgi:hypothetical protein